MTPAALAERLCHVAWVRGRHQAAWIRRRDDGHVEWFLTRARTYARPPAGPNWRWVGEVEAQGLGRRALEARIARVFEGWGAGASLQGQGGDR